MTLVTTGKNGRRYGIAIAALLVLAAAAVARASDADARSWTRTVDLQLSPRQLGLPASSSPRRLARAALSRSARRLGLPRSLAGLRLQRDLRGSAGPSGGQALRTLRYTQTAAGRRLVFSQIDVVIGGGVVRAIDATVVPVGRGRPAARPRISSRRALAVAHRAV